MSDMNHPFPCGCFDGKPFFPLQASHKSALPDFWPKATSFAPWGLVARGGGEGGEGCAGAAAIHATHLHMHNSIQTTTKASVVKQYKHAACLPAC